MIPLLIVPIREALKTKDPEIVTTVLHLLQKMMAAHPAIGRELVPYYRQVATVRQPQPHRLGANKTATAATGAVMCSANGAAPCGSVNRPTSRALSHRPAARVRAHGLGGRRLRKVPRPQALRQLRHRLQTTRWQFCVPRPRGNED